MDIDLLAKMVKEVVLDHDSVTLPGVGSFVAELVPAAFADRGYTILPPYRRLYFSPRQGSDTLLADFYRKANPELSEADATRILTEYLAEMKEVLKQRKTLILPGLGRLRATRENHFFFVADEDLDIWPAGFGLQPISLKTHEETPEEVAGAVSALAGILEQKAVPEVPDPVGHDEALKPEEVLEPVSDPEPAAEACGIPEESAIKSDDGISAPSAAASEPEPESEPDSEPEPEAEPEPAATECEIPEESAIKSDDGISAPAAAVVPEEMPDQVVQDEAPKPRSKGWKVFWRVLLIIGILVVLAVVALVVVGRVVPEWLDPFLYSPEELDILRNSY